MLGKESALRPAARYYQRLLARDRFEAEAVVKEYLAGHPVEDLFDRVLIPALVLFRRGQKAGELRPEDEAFFLRTTREIIDQLVGPIGAESDPGPSEPVVIFGVPAADGADELALVMLRTLWHQAGAGVEVRTTLPTLGAREPMPDNAPVAVLVAAVGPGGLTEARYLCRRFRDQHPGVKIVVGRWGRVQDVGKARSLLQSAGADRVMATLREVRIYMDRLVRPLLPASDIGSPAV
jgi:hypothetical protein